MLSTLWALILLDLKGKEKVKHDSGCVVTGCKLALLMHTLIKYQREALAMLVLQRGNSQPKPLSAGSEHHWQSFRKHRVCSAPMHEALHSLPLLITPARYSEEEGTAISFCLILFLHPLSTFKRKRFMRSIPDFIVLIFFSLREI